VDFGTTIIVLSIVAAVVACLSYIGSGRLYERVGKSGLFLDTPDGPAEPLSRGADEAQLREEVRQLVVARNERRARQGEEPLDVEAEVERRLRELQA
jgi:hypothetical protein